MVVLMSLLLLIQGAPAKAPSPGPSRTVTCSFSNPGYSGWCRIVENVPPNKTPSGVCRDVLKCLNNVRCIKTYCNATEIRIHWKLERVKSERGAP